MPLSPLPVSFYSRNVVEVARDLLGMRLVRELNEPGQPSQRLAGIISETEAYAGESDLACHARSGRTPRTEVMYGPPGHAYVYFVYGMHWMLNVVAEPEGSPSAVLIRAILPVEGVADMQRFRHGVNLKALTNGPAKLCQAMQIDRLQNGADLTTPDSGLWIEQNKPVPDADLITGPRVGIDYAGEPWVSKPWRFQINLNRWNQSDDSSKDDRRGAHASISD